MASYVRVRKLDCKPALLILSDRDARFHEPSGREVCISITDPYRDPAQLSPLFQDVLRVCFTDLTSARLARQGDIPFSTQHAEAILAFARRWRDVDRVVVHCQHGRSRSPGVALALCDLLDLPTTEIEREFPDWNRIVRALLVEVGNARADEGTRIRPAKPRQRRVRRTPRGGSGNPELLILSEHRARSYEPAGREVCISIKYPGGPTPRLSTHFVAVLRLAFSDIAKPSSFEWDVLFNEQHARKIVAFVREWAGVERIVIHCMAGQSRSPGVAMGLCELFSWSLADLEQRYPLWNTWVRGELVRVGRELMEP